MRCLFTLVIADMVSSVTLVHILLLLPLFDRKLDTSELKSQDKDKQN